MDMVKMGSFLAELRKEQKLTQAELGEKLGVTNKTVSRWETGTYMPPVEILEELSRLYGLTINEILSGRKLTTEEYKEMANDYRHHNDVKEIYKQRSTHIERLYADGKMKHGLGKTYFRTKERVSRELTLLYACMNLKKFALHHYA